MSTATPSAPPGTGPILLLGQPNVGKSALFGALTGMHATVSNYPGTTVGVSRGTLQLGSGSHQLIDTPGAYSLLPVSDEERVTRDALFAGAVGCVLHVVEARNLDRALSSSLELRAAGLPLVLVLNMADEAEALGVHCEVATLAERLGCEVVQTVAVRGEGLDELRAAVERCLAQPPAPLDGDTAKIWRDLFGPLLDEMVTRVIAPERLPAAMPPQIAAALVLRGAQDLSEAFGYDAQELQELRQRAAEQVGGMPPVAAILALRRRAESLLDGVFERSRSPAEARRHRFGLLLGHPLWGLPVLAAVLYLGFYQLVGVWVAGDVVGLLEEDLFGGWLMPMVESGVQAVLPWEWLQSLFVGPYGILTLGITYALALVLPVVGAFFVLFSVVEDSGYFPRLALLCDKLFRLVGLNGRAVITMVLGLGCSTMATVTTRTLETRRERVIATLLLVLTIPCSAQLGLIMGLLGSRGFGLWAIYAGCLVAVFAVVGTIAARVLPGRNATFHMELVPMRWPRPGNVLRKTWQRLYWYFREVVPLFIYASVLLWLLDMKSATLFGTTEAGPGSALDMLRQGMEPLMALLDQPREAAESFLIGFFRRDFGAAGLYQTLQENPGLAFPDRQLLVGCFTLTLFVPCVASFMMMIKERGARVATLIFVFVTATAFASGVGLNQVLLLLGWE